MENKKEWRTDSAPVGQAVIVTVEYEGKREVETGIKHGHAFEDSEWYIYERGGYLRSGKVVAWRYMPEPFEG